MDASSIITQVSRDDEQLNCYPQGQIEKGNQNGKKPRKNIFRTLFCCCLSDPEPPIAGANGTCIPEETQAYGHLIPQSAAPQHFLLPPISHRDMHKKCMVIDLDETLVHSSFKPISNADFIVPVEIDGTVHQVYVLKRPFVDEFLQKMGELYECVLFTASLAKYADPVANLLDKWNVFRARLFREACVFHRGNYVKDLGRLGRDLHKVVIMDNSPASYIFHPDNAVPVSSWFDDMSDSELIDLIPFLDTLSKVDNIYTVLQNCNNPLNSLPAPNGPSDNVETRSNNGGTGGGNGKTPQIQGPITQVLPPMMNANVQGGSSLNQFSSHTQNLNQNGQPLSNKEDSNEERDSGS